MVQLKIPADKIEKLKAGDKYVKASAVQNPYLMGVSAIAVMFGYGHMPVMSPEWLPTDRIPIGIAALTAPGDSGIMALGRG